MNVQALIDKAGGVGKLAARLGVTHTTVVDWKNKGGVPGARVSQISTELGLPVEEVLALVPPPKSRAA